MKRVKNNTSAGFSLAELMLAMTITLLLLGLVSGLFSRALGTRARESRRTDALTSAQAALNVMSREISNAGYGIFYLDNGTRFPSNGVIAADSNNKRIHFRANITNENGETSSSGEDVTYFFDKATDSIVRYDPHGIGKNTPLTSVIVNRISDVTFAYFNYDGTTQPPKDGTTIPSENTGRVRITITVKLDHVQGQPDNQVVTFTSDVTLRNSNYMLNQY
ncbi:MAG: prepilin-type N-terminal cleavage/methylation domain-containing protein [Acidobacteriota bacterium]|nr:prepilin-type N-terminal cleavage/methylation domain-containing protein [Acidobacteriota bacterium]